MTGPGDAILRFLHYISHGRKTPKGEVDHVSWRVIDSCRAKLWIETTINDHGQECYVINKRGLDMLNRYLYRLRRAA